MTRGSHKPTKLQLAYLGMFGPETYGINLPPKVARIMERAGWVEWVPPKFGSTLHAITERGKNELAKARLEAVQ